MRKRIVLVLAASAVLGAAAAGCGGGGSDPAGEQLPPESAGVIASPGPILVGAGDIAEWPPGRRGKDEATARLVDRIVARHPGRTVVITLGDNAYDSGLMSEYRQYYVPTWGRHRAITRPVPGNHDYYSAGAAGYYRYFRVLPYYAFEVGTWRIYALNSEVPHRAGSAQVRWLRRDLAAHPARCVLAYWHRPRYSSGPHGSNGSMETLWQALADRGAALVLSGHDHDYERFAPRAGIRQLVVGTGGNFLYPIERTIPGSVVHDDRTFGVIVVALHPDGYDFEFVPVAGQTFSDRGSGRCR